MPANVYNVNMSSPAPPDAPVGQRGRYHHGNLAAALIDAGYDLAAEGGPNAVTVREAARRVGVSAPAAYRHFTDRDEFLSAVAARCRRELAISMIAARNRHRAPQHRFEAVGRGYIDFAMRNPHLIDTAFAEIPNKGGPNTIDPGPEDPNAFMVLVGALASVVSLGYYLRLVWAMFMKPAGEPLDKTDISVGATVAISTLLMFPVLTIAIQFLLDLAYRATGG